MKHLKVCFVGIGSIAKRHIGNLKEICETKRIELQIDAFRRNPESVEGVNSIYTRKEDLPSDYDVIFITNPTDQHLDTIIRFQNNGKHFFVEKPVVSREQIEAAKQFVLNKESAYYVAAPLRYNAVIQWIKNNVNTNDVISVRSISSSYLPDWRPGQDYRQTYSAHKDMGGGVSIDLIHEWDYLTYLFGWPEKVSCMIGQKSQLEIDTDDYAIYIAEYPNMISELHLDYFGRKTIREIELFTKDDTIVGDIARNQVVFMGSGKTIDFHEERDDYQKRELSHFLETLSLKSETGNGFYHAIRVLELTQGRS